MRSALLFALPVMFGTVAWPTAAKAQVTKPFPGVTLVRHGGRALAVGDLCAAGVTVRATKYDERKRTPESWAGVSGAAVAVNVDFFDFSGATHVNGRARGAGQDWPADKQFVEYTALGEVRSYWQFGPNATDLVSPSTTAPNAKATEIVGAHNVIIRGGKSLAPGFDGDGVILGAYRRTGIGVDAARAHVYLFASNDALNGAVMAQTMIDYAKEAGAPPIDEASNEDGGGSSQMYVKGQGQIVTSGRLVANHLGIVANGAGPSPMCPNQPPKGFLDSAACEELTGWAQDPDEPTKPIAVHLYFDGVPGAKDAKGIDIGAANVKRDDLCKPLGDCTHGFAFPTPFGLIDGKEHVVRAYAIDSKGGQNPELEKSAAKLTCTPDAVKTPPSVKRLLSPEAFAAWKLDAFRDVLVLGDDAVKRFADGKDPAPASPRLVRADGAPEVYLVDGAQKRHVTSPAVAQAWHFDLGKVEVRPAAEVQAMPTGVALRKRPWIVKGAGATTWLLDEVPGATAPGDQPGATPSANGPGSPQGADAEDDGGGCSTAPGRPLGPVLAVLGALAVLARRRRRA